MPQKKPVDSVALDFSGVKPFEAMDEGVVYLCQADKLELGTSKNQNPKVHLEASILGPEEVSVADFDGKSQVGVLDKKTKAKGRKLFREYSLIADALPFLFEFLKGIDPEAELDENFIFKPKDWMGQQFACKIKLEEYNGVINARIARVLPVTAYKG